MRKKKTENVLKKLAIFFGYGCHGHKNDVIEVLIQKKVEMILAIWSCFTSHFKNVISSIPQKHRHQSNQSNHTVNYQPGRILDQKWSLTNYQLQTEISKCVCTLLKHLADVNLPTFLKRCKTYLQRSLTFYNQSFLLSSEYPNEQLH